MKIMRKEGLHNSKILKDLFPVIPCFIMMNIMFTNAHNVSNNVLGT